MSVECPAKACFLGLLQIRGNLRAPREEVLGIISDGVRKLFGGGPALCQATSQTLPLIARAIIVLDAGLHLPVCMPSNLASGAVWDGCRS